MQKHAKITRVCTLPTKLERNNPTETTTQTSSNALSAPTKPKEV